MIFPPDFSKSGAFGMLHLPKLYVVLKVLTEDKVCYFSQTPLRADAAHNNWLKQALWL